MLRTILSLLSVMLFVGSCCVVPKQADLEAAYYGAPPDQDFAERLAKIAVGVRLKDPDSATYRFDSLYAGYTQSSEVVIGDCEPIYGYILNTYVNAKNSFGGYTGYKLYVFVFRDNKVVGMCAGKRCRSI